MPRLTEEHPIYCVEELIKTGSIVGTKRKLKTAFGIEVSRPAFRPLLKKWQTKGTTKNQNKKNSGRRRSARNEETIDAVKARIADPTVSLRKLVSRPSWNLNRVSSPHNEERYWPEALQNAGGTGIEERRPEKEMGFLQKSQGNDFIQRT